MQNNKLEIRYLSKDEITPYSRNSRTHSADQIEKLKRSIVEFGMNTPIGIRNGVIVYGHARFEALKQLGYKEFPTVDLSHLNEEQTKAYVIGDNRLSLDAGWDAEMLELEMQDLYSNGFDIELTGFSMDELLDMDINLDLDGEDEKAEVDESLADEVPEVEENPVIKLGDIIELGHKYQHRLMCGDSTKEEDVAKLIGKDKIDFIHTDPPYGINLDGDNSKRGSDTSLMAGGLKLKSFKDDTIEYAVKAMHIVESYKIKKQVWWGANYYAHHFPQTNNWLVWDKRVEEKMRNTNSDCELAYVIDGHNSVRIFRHLWNGLIKASEKQDKRVHPTQKPYALTEYCIAEYAPEAKTVLDLFSGSGSTLIGCENMNKSFRGMEFEPHYTQVIIQRYVDYTSNPMIKINGKEVDWYEYKESNTSN